MAKYPNAPSAFPVTPKVYPGVARGFPASGIASFPTGVVSLVAPSLFYVAPQVGGASGNTRAGDLSPIILQRYDIICALFVDRVTNAATVTTSAPAGEGWSRVPMFAAASHTVDFYWKRWGDGFTDNLSPIFTLNAAGGASLGLTLWVIRGAKRTGNPFSQITSPQVNGASNTITTPLTAATPPVTSFVMWLGDSTDDNSVKSPTVGTLGFGDTAYNVSTAGSMYMAYAVGTDTKVTSCSFTESINGPDSSVTMTLVCDGDTALNTGYTVTQLTTTAYARSRVNDTGWRGAAKTDPIVRSGFVYRYVPAIKLDKSIVFTCLRRAVGSSTWAIFAQHQTAIIPDPALISTWPSDAHMAITVGVSKNGLPQIWFQGHGTEAPMLFWQGASIGDVNCDTFTTWSNPVQGSYPEQFNTSDGNSYFSCRIGTAGNDAQQCLFKQDAGEATWTQITAAIMNFTDGTGDDESPYMQRMRYDKVRDELHVSWCWAKANVTNQYHGVLYVKGKCNVSTHAWTWQFMDGTTATLPVLDTDAKAIVDSVGVASGLNVHNGMGFDPATGYPKIPYMKAKIAGTGNNTSGTNFHLGGWNGSALVSTFVCEAHPTWNTNNAPPDSERAVVRGPEWFKIGSSEYFVWTADNWLSTSGRPCLMYVKSTDGGSTWTSPARLVDQDFGGATPRVDQDGLDVFGTLTFYLQYLDDNDGTFIVPTSSTAAIVDVTPP